jgi:hypothetical protein
MTCIELLVWVGSGILIVPLLAILKAIPGQVGQFFQDSAWLMAGLLALILPQIATALTPYCGQIDPALWVVVYTALAYLVSQAVWWINKKLGISDAALKAIGKGAA